MQKKAFTIIELLVVIVMIGLLTSAAAASYITSQRHARDSSRKTTVNNIATAVESYYSQHHSFPGKAMLKQPASTPTTPPVASADCESWTGFNEGGISYDGFVYMYNASEDPAKGGTYCSSRAANNAVDVTGQKVFDPTLYTPAGSWIPGLGDYLSPFPVERNFLDANGGTSGVALDFLCKNAFAPCDGGNADQSRTIVYRPLMNGYLIYARLESSNDSNAATASSLANGTDPSIPFVPSDIAIPSGTTAYLVRK